MVAFLFTGEGWKVCVFMVGQYNFIWILCADNKNIPRIFINKLSRHPLGSNCFVAFFVFRVSWVHWAVYNRPFKTHTRIFSYNWWISLILVISVLLMPKIFPWFPLPNFNWFYTLLLIFIFVVSSIFSKVKNK